LPVKTRSPGSRSSSDSWPLGSRDDHPDNGQITVAE
jgi:hypothetical protein